MVQFEVLENPNQPVIDAVTSTDPTDCGTIDGTITINATAPGGNVLQYSIDGGATFQLSPTFNGLTGGTYNIAVRNADGTCLVNGPIEILINKTPPVINNVVASNPSDCSSNDGQISIGATFNPVPGIEFSIDGGVNWQVSNTFFGLAPGTYNVAVRNVDGTCTVLDINNPVVLVAPDAPAITNVSTSDPTDCGSADGTIVIAVTGGDGAPYQYSIDGGANFFQNNGVFTNLAGGDYDIVVRNGNGTCQVVGPTATLEDKFPPVINNVAVSHTSNCGNSDGIIDIQATSAATNSALEYSINGGATWQPSNIFVGLSAGAYDVRVRNQDGTCEVTYPAVIINAPVSTDITNVVAVDPTGCSTNDGTITVTATGSSLEYSIDGGTNWQSSSVFSGLGSGTYNVFVRNGNGSCQSGWMNNPVTLTAPSAPTIVNVQSISPTDCGLVDGMIAITAGNGTGTYEYSIDSGDTWVSNGTFSNLNAGIYYVFVRNSNGTCAVQGPVVTLTLKAPPIVASVNSTNPTDCGVADGTISIIASQPFGGALEYSIDGGSTYQSSNVFSNLTAGTYEIRVRNADGTCVVSEPDVVLVSPTPPTIVNVASVEPTNCGLTDGSITVTATGAGPLEYSIDGGLNWQVGNVFNGLGAGSYNVAVRNTSGTCMILDAGNPVILTSPNAPAITSVNSTEPTDCGTDDGTITITATGGTAPLEYSINGGTSWQSSNIFTGLGGGNYTPIVRNVGPPTSCEVAGQTVTLTDKVQPSITSVTSNNPTDCGVVDGTITITANSGGSVEYSIDGGLSWQPSNVFSGLSGGTYQIRVRNIDGTCMVSNPNVDLVDPIAPTINNVASTDETNCGTADGTITVTATGASIEYSIDGGLTYQTNGGSFTGLSAGTYYVSVRNTVGTCEVMYASNPVIIDAPNAPSITSVNFTEPTDCGFNDGSITITATGGTAPLEYSIDGFATSNTTGVFIGLAGGTYTPEVRNSDQSCAVAGQIVTLTDKVAPVIVMTTGTDPSDCGLADGEININASSPNGSSLQFSIDGGANWQPGGLFTNLTGGTYQIRVRNADGTCMESDVDVTLTSPIAPVISSVVPADPTNCGVNDGSITITATGAGIIEYSIDGGLNWSLNGTFANLAAGTYNVAVRNVNGTCTVLDAGNPVTLIAPNAPSIVNVSSNDPTDCSVTDGSITLTGTGGSGSYQYTIDGGNDWSNTTGVFTGLAGGFYQVGIRNADGTCEALGQTVVLTDKALPSITNVAPTDPTDCGVNDGTITITASSTQGSVEYSINGGGSWQPSNFFAGLSGGSYDIRVRNIDGTCEVTHPTVTLVAPITPVINSVTALDATGCNTNDGSITVNATGVSLEYSIDGGLNWQASNVFNGLNAGVYNVAVRNTSGTCTVLSTDNPITIEAPNAPIITSVNFADPTDCGLADGTITITATGGTGGIEYSIDNFATFNTTGVFTGLTGGTYTTYVRNTGNAACVITGQIVDLTDKVAPVIVSVTPNNPSDCGLTDGQITINATSPNGSSMQFSIDGGANWQPDGIFTNLIGGTYQIRVRNADGTCEVNDVDVTLVDPIAPVISDVAFTNSTDCGNNNGTITITASGVGIIEYSIDGGINWTVSSTFNNLGAGVYNVVVRNVNGTCEVMYINNPVILTAPNAPSITSVSSTDPTDCGQADGTITVLASGGLGTYEYTNDGGLTWQASNIFNGLSGGTYQVGVRNDDGTCEVLGQVVTLQDKALPSITNVVPTNPTDCGLNDGTITITATSAQGSVEYSINGGSSWQPSNVFSNLGGGTYEVRVRNIDGTCMVSYPDVDIIAPIEPIINSATATDATNCANPDGTITVDAIGASLEYSIDGGLNYQPSNVFSGLNAGVYNVAVRNTNGTCEVLYGNNPVIIDAPSAPSITSVNFTQPTDCGANDATITIAATGGTAPLEYSIDGFATSNTTGTFTNVAAGTYTTSVRNADGSCEVTGQIVIIEDKVEPIIVSVTGNDPSDCGLADGQITINATSPIGNSLQFSIDGGANWQPDGIFTNLTGGTYEIRVRNGDGTCVVTSTDVVLENKVAPVITDVQHTDLTNCNTTDGTITILATGTGIIEYSIDGGFNWQATGNFTGLLAGTYNVVVRNIDGTCEVMDAGNPVILDAPSAPSITSIVSNDPSDCGVADGDITITATSGNGNALQYSIDGGTTWMQNGGVFTGLTGGTYTIAVQYDNGTCTVQGQVVILEDKASPTISNVTSTNPTDCGINDGTITITAASTQGSVEYSINGGLSWQPSNVFSNLTDGTYQVRVRNIDGTCEASAPNVDIVAPVEPTISSVVPTSPTNCNINDGSIVVTANGQGALEYSIDGGLNWQANGNFTALASGTYNVAVRNANGTCTVLDVNNPVILTAPSTPAITSVNSTQPTDCGSNDGSITIIASGGTGSLEYSIGGAWQSSNTFTGLGGGNYTPIVRNDNGTCEATGQMVTLVDKVAPVITSVTNTDPSDCGLNDATITIVATSPNGSPIQYSIDGGVTWDGSGVFAGLSAGTYEIRVRNTDGTCMESASDVVITAPVAPSITDVQSTDPSNCGTNDGTITVTASGAGQIEYSIDGGFNWQNSGNFTGLSAGTYNVVVRNIDGSCEVMDAGNPITLTIPSAATINSVVSTDPTDCGVTDGTITITATSGTGAALQYSVDGGTSWHPTSVFTNLGGGTYVIMVQYADGTCQVQGQTTVLEDKATPAITNVASTNPTDCGVDDGTITITATSAGGSVEYSINGGATWQPANIFVGLAGGTYQVRVRNIDGTCEVSAPNVDIVAPVLPVIVSVTKTDPADCSTANGEIVITATGAGLEYSIDGGLTWQPTGTFSGLAGGAYYVAVRNVTGTCMVLDANNPVILVVPSAPVITSVNFTQPTDCGVDDGTISITASGGSSTLEYSINGTNWFSTSTFTGLGGGNYTTYVRNADGTCQTTGQIAVLNDKQGPVIDAVTSSNPTDCGLIDGSITILATSPSGAAIEYSIDGGSTFQSSNVFSNLSGATYQIRVRNADATCEVSGADVVIEDKVPPVITSVTPTDPANCGVDDGTIVITAMGGVAPYEFSIDGGLNWQLSGTFTGLASGNYNAAVRNTDGSCVTLDANNPITLVAPNAPSITSVNFTDPTDCGVSDGTITITATGGSGSLRYSINGGLNFQISNVFTGLSGNTYIPVVENVDGTCPTSGQIITLEDKAQPIISNVASTNPTDCGLADGTITITANSTAGSVEYSIDGGATWQPANIFVGLAGSTYEIRVRNIDGTCTVPAPDEILVDPVQPVIVSVTASDPTDCSVNDGSIIINATGASLEYSIDGGFNWQNSGTFTGLGSITANVAVRNADGTCMTMDVNNPYVLTAPAAPSITSVLSSDPTDCGVNDGTITISATGSNLEYSIDGGGTYQASNIFTGLAGGTYTPIVRSNGVCEVSGQQLVLTDKVAPVIVAVASTDPSDCGLVDGTITINASSPNGSSLQFSIDGGSNWQPDGVFVNLAGGTYEISVRNGDGTCVVDDADIILNDKTPPTITSVTPVDPSGCGINDGSITIVASGANTVEYSINGGANWQPTGTFANLGSGSYDVMVRNIDGSCEVSSASNPAILAAPAAPSITNVATTNPTDCGANDGSIVITASGSNGTLEYSIDGGLTYQASNIFSNLAGGSYPTMVRYDNGTCEVTGQIAILDDKMPPAISNVASTDITDCGLTDGTITITAASAQGSVEYSIDGGSTWQPANIFVGLSAGTYPIRVRNIDGTCEVSSASIVIDEPVLPIINGVAVNNPTDCAINDGSIVVTATGAALEYSINNGGSWQASGTFNGLTSGTYDIIVRNIAGGTCEVLYTGNSVTLTAPSAPTITNVATTDPTDCNLTDGTITITAIGGNGTLEYSIDGGNTWLANGGIFTNQSGGSYQTVVRNAANGGTCEVQGPIAVINDLQAPVITMVTAVDPTNCGVTDGTIVITATSSGSLQYSIDNGGSWQASDVFVGLSGGTYTPMVRNIDGTCEISGAPVTITDKVEPTITNVTAVDPTDCAINDGTITVTATGSGIIEYSIDGGLNWQLSGSFTGLGSITANVAVRNIDGTCMVMDNNNPYVLAAPSSPTITSIQSTDVTECNVTDGTITISVVGGTSPYQYSIDGGTTFVQNGGNFTGLTAGNYTIVIANTNGSCPVVDPTVITIDAPSQPIITSVTPTNPSDCNVNDGVITINATSTNALEYTIDGINWQASNNFLGLAGGTFYTSS